MGITKLMHLKEGSPTRHTHLRNAIRYILSPEKTKDGLLAGGNSGTEPMEILASFLETKREFGKLSGRQGYHFVISFAKGETDEQTAYKVVQDFCREYLGDGYDYVFAVHDDKEHVHGHIIFNSLDRMEGYKYRYQKGDWEKQIQPVTDRVCARYGLKPLEYDREERAGESYAGWKSPVTNRMIAKADIDYAVERADSMGSFFAELEKMGYEIRRHGMSRTGESREEYFSMLIPPEKLSGTGREGKKTRAVRNRSLGRAYTVEAIRERIDSRQYRKSYEAVMEKMRRTAGDSLKPIASFHSKSQVRLSQAAGYYRLPNPYAVPAWRVREDMKRLDRLAEQCRYLKQNGITSTGQLEARQKFLKEQIGFLMEERKTLYRIRDDMGKEVKEACARLRFLEGQLARADITDALWEQFADEKEALEAALPEQAANAGHDIGAKSAALKALRKEERLVRDILETERQPLPGLRIADKAKRPQGSGLRTPT